MRSLVIALCILGIPCVSSAQASRSWAANLSTLGSGQKLQVVKTNSRKGSARLSNVSTTAVSLQQTAGAQLLHAYADEPAENELHPGSFGASLAECRSSVARATKSRCSTFLVQGLAAQFGPSS